MKKLLWGLCFVFVVPSLAQSQEVIGSPWGNKFFVPKNPPPVVVHDFGTVPWGTTLTHRFKMTNIYAVPMQVMNDPRPSCGCTTVLRYTQKLEPRESGFIDVEMDARRFQGAKEVTIPVRFGPQFQSTALLQVRAFSRTDVTVRPGQVAFGTVAQGQLASQTIDIQYTGQQLNWQITGVEEANSPNVGVNISRMNAARGTMVYRLKATLKANAASGILQDQIILKTNDPNSPLITIPVSGSVQAPLAVVQGTSVRLDPTMVGQEAKRTVMIRATKPFKIMKVDGEGDGVTITYFNIPNSITQNVTIVFKPTQAGQLQRKILLYTDQKDIATILVEGVSLEP